MAVSKYLALVAGKAREVLFLVTSAGAGDAGKPIATDTDGRISPTLLPVGVGADTYSDAAFENLSAGAYVYIRPDGKVANASGASGGTQASGFVLSAVAANAQALVYFEGRNTALTGLTPGARLYLSDTTPGGFTTTPVDNTNPANSGKLHQFLGEAITASSATTELEDAIVLG